MYCRFYLLVKSTNFPLAFWIVPAAQSPLRHFSDHPSPLRPSTSKWGLFSFVCLVAQLFQSCDRSHGIVDRSMGDIDGPVVAQCFYEELFREGNEQLHPDDIPFALDAAVHKLWTSGLHPSSRWAPYVHYGI
jgi:hypothetical protein